MDKYARNFKKRCFALYSYYRNNKKGRYDIKEYTFVFIIVLALSFLINTVVEYYYG